jgi:hypothetical protein
MLPSVRGGTARRTWQLLQGESFVLPTGVAALSARSHEDLLCVFRGGWFGSPLSTCIVVVSFFSSFSESKFCKKFWLVPYKKCLV